MSAAMLAGLGAQAALGIIGEILAGMDEAEAEKFIQASMNQYGAIDLPKLQQLVFTELPPSELAKYTADPELVGMQKEALGEVMNVARNGGMRLQDKATLNEAMGEASRAESAGRNRIMEDLAARGGANSGTALLSQMSNQQRSAQRTADTGVRVAGDAQKRALDAMLAGGRMAGDVRGQDFGEKSRIAAAQDEIRRFNTEGRMKAGQYNNQMLQQGYGNQMGMADRRANYYTQRAQMKRDAAQGKRQMFGGMGKAAATGGQAYSNYMDDEEGF